MKDQYLALKAVVQYKDMLWQLVLRDIRNKYKKSVLGYLWSILNPLLLMMVMTVVFSRMFQKNIANFPVYLFTAQMLFNFMKMATNQAMTSITGNAALIKKTYVPQIAFTIAKVLSCFTECVFSFAALLIIMIITGAPFSLYMLLTPLVLIQVCVFSLGLGLFLAVLMVFFQDIKYLYSAVTTAWMYLTPVFYPMTSVSEQLQYLISHFNPMYLYIEQFRDIILYGCLPDIKLVLKGIIVAVIFFEIGIITFLKKQKKFILYI